MASLAPNAIVEPTRVKRPGARALGSLATALCLSLLFAGWAESANAYVHRGVTRVGPRGGVYHRGATYGRGGYAYHGGVTRVGPRGGVYHAGGTVVGNRAWGVRPWVARPYYGAVVAGVTLGTIVGVAAYNAAPAPPAPNLCWSWTDEARLHGYWAYCE
jgi:hypothetical protein